MTEAYRLARIKWLQDRNKVLLDEIVRDSQREYFAKQSTTAANAKKSPSSVGPQSYYAAPVASSHAADPVQYIPGAQYYTQQPTFAVPDVNPASVPELQGHTLVGSSTPRMNPNEVASLLYAQQQLHAEGIPLPEHIPESGQYARMREVERAIPITDPVRKQIAAAGTPYGIPGAGTPQIVPRPQDYYAQAFAPTPQPAGPTRQFPDILQMIASILTSR